MMIKPAQAEVLATEKLQEYVAACGCKTQEDLGNALLKFLSVTGQAILKTHGLEVAVAMMHGTAAHLAKPQFSRPATTH